MCCVSGSSTRLTAARHAASGGELGPRIAVTISVMSNSSVMPNESDVQYSGEGVGRVKVSASAVSAGTLGLCLSQ